MIRGRPSLPSLPPCSSPHLACLRDALWADHPAVLQLIEIVTSPEGCHLLTELMEHGELFDVLDNCAFSEQTCRMVALQIASALAHLHLRHKVAHCDVKPANVLCRCADPTVPGSLKLADFGFCQRFTRRTAREFTITCGTFEYFAPELVANRNSQARNPQRAEGSPLVRYGSHVDCWSLGCVVYEMLHGEPPYYSKDDETQLQLIAAHELHFPDESFGQVRSSPAGVHPRRRRSLLPFPPMCSRRSSIQSLCCGVSAVHLPLCVRR